jgi:hypothetical protein
MKAKSIFLAAMAHRSNTARRLPAGEAQLYARLMAAPIEPLSPRCMRSASAREHSSS